MKFIFFAALACVFLLGPAKATASGSQDCFYEPLIGLEDDIALFRQSVESVARRFNIAPIILVTIKRTESGLEVNPEVTNSNTDGTTDLSVMQINYEVWSEELRRIGISLPRDQYLNIYNSVLLSGWILRRHLNRFGGDAYEAVGRYHSGTPHLKRIYQDRFSKQLRQVIAYCQSVR